MALVARYRRRWREGGVRLTALAAGLALAVAPLVARNLAVGAARVDGQRWPLTFVAANEAATDVTIGSSVNVPCSRSSSADRIAAWMSAWTAATRDHTVISYVELLARKLDRAWHWYEIPNNANF